MFRRPPLHSSPLFRRKRKKNPPFTVAASVWSRGNTLIEVMIGMVLTSILIFALSGTWVMVSDEFFKLTLRQKAIFILNGEMERLVAAFRYKDPAGDWLVVIGAGDRYIYNSTTEDDLKNVITTTTMDDASFANSQIHHLELENEEKNVLWLDKERQITATLNFTFAGIIGPTACFWNVNNLGPNGANCRLLTVYLKYPFRFQDGDHPITDMGPTSEISLQTIVGGLK